MSDTEIRLTFWRDGSTQAERLAATALSLCGFEEIDPQAPLGGPDGKKDIICSKGGVSWVGAVYFPTGPVTFSAVKTKFKHDLAGVSSAHGGIAFVTNQGLTIGQRKSLADLAEAAGKDAFLLHLERLRALLDSPSGFGTRIQFLKVAMTLEEQLSWFSESGNQVVAAVTANTREVLALKALIGRLDSGQAEIRRTLTQVTAGAAQVPTPDLLSTANFELFDVFEPTSARLDAAQVLLFHRLVCFDLPTRMVGRLRTKAATLSGSDGLRARHVQPPPAEMVRAQLEALCSAWRGKFPRLQSSSIDERLSELASFHARLLMIHPFSDGNGRVAKSILMQQCLDLFGRADMSLMDKGAAYYRALAAADAGDFEALARLIRPIAKG